MHRTKEQCGRPARSRLHHFFRLLGARVLDGFFNGKHKAAELHRSVLPGIRDFDRKLCTDHAGRGI